MTEPLKRALRRLSPWAKVAGSVTAIAALGALLGTPIGWAVSAIVAPEARAQAAEVVAPVKADVAELKADVAEMRRDVAEMKLEGARTGIMVGMLLRLQGVHPPPPVAPVDGGP